MCMYMHIYYLCTITIIGLYKASLSIHFLLMHNRFQFGDNMNKAAVNIILVFGDIGRIFM